MLPIVFMIISAMMLWAQDLINQLKKYQAELEGMGDEIENALEFIYPELDEVEGDDFEGEFLVWDKIENGGVVYFDQGEEFHHYKSRTKSVRLETTAAGDEAGIEKPFAWQPFDEISIEISFTIHPFDEYKYFGIYQDGNINEANVRYDVQNNRLEYYDPNAPPAELSWPDLDDSLSLTEHEHCWHTLRIELDFDYHDDPDEDPHYSTIILDNTEYTLANNKDLINPQTAYPGSTIWVEFKTVAFFA